MPYYFDLLSEEKIEKSGYPRLAHKSLLKSEKKRAIRKILDIKNAIKKQRIPLKRDDNLLVASWNLKDFGNYKHPEFLFYISEIMFAFDLVIIQEVNRSLTNLTILNNILGSDWKFIVNDVTEGDAGNNERSAILFNTKRVQFSGFSGELITDGKTLTKRTPQITGFMAGWKKFAIVNVHLKAGDDNHAVRLKEVKDIMGTLKPKIASQDDLMTTNIVLAGDCNFVDTKDQKSYKELTKLQFEQVERLKKIDASLGKSHKTYDRFFIRRNKYMQLSKVANPDTGELEENAGVFEFRSLFQKDLNTYKKLMKSDYANRNNGKVLQESKIENYYWVHWLSRQMSDHYPIWFELNTDSSVDYLTSKLEKL